MTAASSTSNRHSLAEHPRAKLVRYLVIGGAACLIAAGLYASSHRWLPLVGFGEEQVAPAQVEAVSDKSPMEITLPAEKLAAAGIQLAEVQEQSIAQSRTVPGKLEYNSNHRLELKAPAASVVKQTLVEAGQQLAAGDKLLILTSNEIGTARDAVLVQTADLELAQKELNFHNEIATNVAALLTYLKDQPQIADLEQQFTARLLGDYRDRIVSAYSKLKLAQSVASSTSGLTNQGVISGRLSEERASAREVAAAGYQAACEEAHFQSKQQRDKAAANVAHCERLLKISQQNLQAMLGPFAVQMNTSDTELSEYTLCAPFAATVQERLVASAERVAVSELLYVLADTEKLYLSAEIHERDWALLSISPGQTLEVRTPAIPDQVFQAVVKRVGSSVSPETRSVALMAELENSQGLFKPGMFMWVTIPQAGTRTASVVPSAAIVRHDAQPFVFVQQSEHCFRRMNVTLGQETADWVEVTAGLKAGDRVVTNGAFFLKSELLLEREAE